MPSELAPTVRSSTSEPSSSSSAPASSARPSAGAPAAGLVTLDGRRRLEVPHASRVEVTRSDVPVRLARLTPAPFTTRLVNKFDLPVDGWRGRPSAPRPTFPGGSGATR